MVTTIALILVSLAGIAVCVRYLRKNLKRIVAKNAEEPSSFKRAMNYPLTVIWYGYLILFFAGLSVNNLIF